MPLVWNLRGLCYDMIYCMIHGRNEGWIRTIGRAKAKAEDESYIVLFLSKTSWYKADDDELSIGI